MSETNKRLEYIDIAKLIGIVLMFIGHRIDEGYSLNFIYLFHMPLFFIMSGMVIKDKEYENFKEIVKSEGKLIILYFFYSLAYILFNYIEDMYYGSTSGMIFKTVTLYGVDSMWFFSTLFLSKVYVKSLNKINDDKKKYFIVVFVYLVSYLLSLFMRNFEYEDLKMRIVKYITFGLLRFGNCSIFVYLGFRFKNNISDLIKGKKYGKKTILICLACIILLAFGSYLPETDYHTLKEGILILNVIFAFAGTILVLCISYLIECKLKHVGKFLANIGKESMHLMTMDHFHLSMYLTALCSYIGLGGEILNVSSTILFAITLIVLSMYVFPCFDCFVKLLNNIIFPKNNIAK